MLTLRHLLLFLTLLTILPAQALMRENNTLDTKDDSTLCLEIEGKVHNADQNGTPCKVEVFQGDKLVDSVILKGKHRKFTLQFKQNHHYTIRISKPGFLTKSICVHTNMQESVDDLLYQFYFETTLFYAKPESIEQPPVATIYFNSKKNCFYYTRTNPYVPGKGNCINGS